MATKIKNLTTDELQELIRQTVNETLDEYLEDLEALSSSEFRESIQEAREEYSQGNVKELGDVVDE